MRNTIIITKMARLTLCTKNEDSDERFIYRRSVGRGARARVNGRIITRSSLSVSISLPA
jgi:hypothetical protein